MARFKLPIILSKPILVAAGSEAIVGVVGDLFYGAFLSSDLTADVKLVIADGSSGTVQFTFQLPGTDDSRLFALPFGISFKSGIYATLTGTLSSCAVFYGPSVGAG